MYYFPIIPNPQILTSISKHHNLPPLQSAPKHWGTIWNNIIKHVGIITQEMYNLSESIVSIYNIHIWILNQIYSAHKIQQIEPASQPKCFILIRVRMSEHRTSSTLASPLYAHYPPPTLQPVSLLASRHLYLRDYCACGIVHICAALSENV